MTRACWFFRHWWREAIGWGTRVCRMCGQREQAMYDSEKGVQWMPMDK